MRLPMEPRTLPLYTAAENSSPSLPPSTFLFFPIVADCSNLFASVSDRSPAFLARGLIPLLPIA